MLETVGVAHIFKGGMSNRTLVSDRFDNSNSALNLNGGYTQVPTDNYFDPPHFNISVWVYPLNLTGNVRVIDFGNGL